MSRLQVTEKYYAAHMDKLPYATNNMHPFYSHFKEV